MVVFDFPVPLIPGRPIAFVVPIGKVEASLLVVGRTAAAALLVDFMLLAPRISRAGVMVCPRQSDTLLSALQYRLWGAPKPNANGIIFLMTDIQKAYFAQAKCHLLRRIAFKKRPGGDFEHGLGEVGQPGVSI